MIGLIGYQEDAIGFALAGIDHVQEIPPQPSKQDIQEAYEQLKDAEIIITREEIQEHLPTEANKHMIIHIPTDNSKEKEIEALTKELLGITL